MLVQATLTTVSFFIFVECKVTVKLKTTHLKSTVVNGLDFEFLYDISLIKRKKLFFGKIRVYLYTGGIFYSC